MPRLSPHSTGLWLAHRLPLHVARLPQLVLALEYATDATDAMPMAAPQPSTATSQQAASSSSPSSQVAASASAPSSSSSSSQPSISSTTTAFTPSASSASSNTSRSSNTSPLAAKLKDLDIRHRPASPLPRPRAPLREPVDHSQQKVDHSQQRYPPRWQRQSPPRILEKPRPRDRNPLERPPHVSTSYPTLSSPAAARASKQDDAMASVSRPGSPRLDGAAHRSPPGRSRGGTGAATVPVVPSVFGRDDEDESADAQQDLGEDVLDGDGSGMKVTEESVDRDRERRLPQAFYDLIMMATARAAAGSATGLVVDSLTREIDSLPLDCVASVMYRCGQLVRDPRNKPHIRAQLEGLMSRCISVCQQQGLSQLDVTKMCQAVSGLGLAKAKVDLALLDEAAERVVGSMEDVPPRVLTGLAWSFARYAYSPLDGKFMDALVRHLSGENGLKGWGSKDLANALWAIGMLRHPLSAEFGSALHSAVTADVLKSCDEGDVSALMWSCCTYTHVFPQQFVDQVAREVSQRVSSLRLRGTVKLIWVLGMSSYAPLRGDLLCKLLRHACLGETVGAMDLRDVKDVLVTIAKVHHRAPPKMVDNMVDRCLALVDRYGEQQPKARGSAAPPPTAHELHCLAKILYALSTLRYDAPQGERCFQACLDLLSQPGVVECMGVADMADVLVSSATSCALVHNVTLSRFWNAAIRKAVVLPRITFSFQALKQALSGFGQHGYLPEDILLTTFVNDFVYARVGQLGAAELGHVIASAAAVNVQLEEGAVNLLRSRATQLGVKLPPVQTALMTEAHATLVDLSTTWRL